jgi:hypothetical protein
LKPGEAYEFGKNGKLIGGKWHALTA